MDTELFNYDLPAERIAQTPAMHRDQSRLLCLDRSTGRRIHTRFASIVDCLVPGDVLVLNDTRVIPARLRGTREGSNGSAEFLLLREVAPNEWWAMLKPGKRLRVGTKVRLLDRNGKLSGFAAVLLEKNGEGHGRLLFDGPSPLLGVLTELGEMPLPPYIRPDAHRRELDQDRYQTVYAQTPGSVAAPTAGLHFTSPLLAGLSDKGVELRYVTLQVGLGTFAPVKSERVENHAMHEETYHVGQETAEAVNRARAEERRVIAVGTTSVRVLESVAAANNGRFAAGSGTTGIFIYPPREFQLVDALVTNFHLPKSTLLMLASAFAAPGSTDGIAVMKDVYREAIERGYRFFSYGDAMFIH
ncbi:MAG TPA: tRNA preQ1(34) S-adenosylmethionine ribosyltransferase-isomerase QueA [Verrucomicrobiales bacterium]|nr:tRNA preQ1(34) S-adenosylmethionine ribosyltransferase-isomerase QueA [Verrucomicrobiales bacterium]